MELGIESESSSDSVTMTIGGGADVRVGTNSALPLIDRYLRLGGDDADVTVYISDLPDPNGPGDGSGDELFTLEVAGLLRVDGDTGTAKMYLSGTSVTTAGSIELTSTASAADEFIDFSDTATLVIAGDVTTQVNGLITANRLTTNDPNMSVYSSYDGTTETTVYLDNCETPPGADRDGDCDVDLDDLAILAASWTTTYDLEDFAQLAADWRKCGMLTGNCPLMN